MAGGQDEAVSCSGRVQDGVNTGWSLPPLGEGGTDGPVAEARAVKNAVRYRTLSHLSFWPKIRAFYVVSRVVL